VANNHQNHRCCPTVSTTVASLPLAGTRITPTLTLIALLLAALTCMAQDQPPAASQAAAAEKETVTIPAGTRLALVLTHPIWSHSTRRGDEIYAQTTSPVTVGNAVVIPAGTFIQGAIDKVSRDGTRGELQMQSAAVIFPNGYTANISAPMTIESDEDTAWRQPTKGGIAAAIAAPAAGLGLGLLIGHAANSSPGTTINGMTVNVSRAESTGIGAVVGGAIGGVIGFALLLHTRQFFVDVGSPMEMTLPQPLSLQTTQVAAALNAPPLPAPMAAPRPLPYAFSSTGTCYTGGSPGTPGTYVPGTPPIGNSPGTPGSFIPGTPPTPPIAYPCP